MQADPLIARLQGVIHDILAPLMAGRRGYALLDFPDHANVGDSAIWLGEIRYFRKRHRLYPAYVCTKDNADWDALERLPPGFPVFLHGGGNFGDLWPEHQRFREEALRRLPNRAIIQLPQSIHFSDPEALRRAAAVINAHPEFTLLVRDRRSYDIAQNAFACTSHLCPDMAFCIGKLPRPPAGAHELLLLLRTDHEKDRARPDAPPPEGAVAADWLEEPADTYRRVRRRAALELLLPPWLRAFDKYRRRELLYRRLAENRLDRGARLLASGRYVITDRLHAHILCALLGLPHAILDNSYGKLGNFAEAWTKELDTLRREPDMASAMAHRRERSQ